MNEDPINSPESEDEYEFQYHNFALPPPARSGILFLFIF